MAEAEQVAAAARATGTESDSGAPRATTLRPPLGALKLCDKRRGQFWGSVTHSNE